jgi:hypothetical protein
MGGSTPIVEVGMNIADRQTDRQRERRQEKKKRREEQRREDQIKREHGTKENSRRRGSGGVGVRTHEEFAEEFVEHHDQRLGDHGDEGVRRDGWSCTQR